ncbi:MAG TPA: hypothetical protein VMV44_15490 [Rectinemataceae bacterium]|nr:hypothetical protein [Rectinemataceae bacterium]
MEVTLILNGGIKSCCSVTPAETIEKAVREWIGQNNRLLVVDVTRDAWEPDSVTSLAYQHFQDEIFPLTYLDGRLARLGELPGRDHLLAMLDGSMPYGIGEEDILHAALRREEELVEAEGE